MTNSWLQACLLGVAGASDLTASYWGSFALGRLLAIPLSTWFSPGLMLGCSLGVKHPHLPVYTAVACHSSALCWLLGGFVITSLICDMGSGIWDLGSIVIFACKAVWLSGEDPWCRHTRELAPSFILLGGWVLPPETHHSHSRRKPDGKRFWVDFLGSSDTSDALFSVSVGWI